MPLVAILLLVCAFDAGQSEAFPNDSDEITVDQYPGFDYIGSEELGGSLGYQTDAGKPEAVSDVQTELDFTVNHPREKRWVPTEVRVDQVMQKVLLSRLVNNRDRSGKRQSRSLRPSTDRFGDAPRGGKPFPSVSLHRYSSKEGRVFTGERVPEEKQFISRPEAQEGNGGWHDNAEHESRVPEMSLMGKIPLAGKQGGGSDISQRKLLGRPSYQQKRLHAMFILSDRLDRQRARKSRRQPQLHPQEKGEGERDQTEQLILTL